MDKSNLTSGSVSGAMLAQFLNVAEGLPKQRVVLDLLEQCRKLQRLLPAVAQGRPLGRVEGTSALIYDLRGNRQAANAVREINRILARHPFRWAVPVTVSTSEGEGPTVQANAYPTRPVPFSNRERGSTIEMHGAIEKVLELARIGALDGLKRCPQCQRWFMAGRRNQEYCSADCTRKNYYEAHRSKWPHYMRTSRLKAKIKNHTNKLLLGGFEATQSDESIRRFRNKRTGQLANIDCRTAEIVYIKKGKHHA